MRKKKTLIFDMYTFVNMDMMKCVMLALHKAMIWPLVNQEHTWSWKREKVHLAIATCSDVHYIASLRWESRACIKNLSY